MVRTLSDLYQGARKTFMLREEPADASLMARNLICSVTKMSHEQFLMNRENPATEEQAATMDFAVSRVLQGEPLAYVLGQWDFYGMTLQLDKNVLIPRDDTCAVTDLAISHALFLGQSPRILDLCTGSGCIGLAIARGVQDARVTLADISQSALAIAKKNVVSHKLTGRVSVLPVNALEPPAAFLGKFDMIVSNPPYITTEEMEELPHSVKDYEPHLALHGGEDGLDFYRSIAKNFSAALKNHGYLCFEFGMGQGDAVCRILEENGYQVLERSRDFNERERAVIAQYYRKDDE